MYMLYLHEHSQKCVVVYIVYTYNIVVFFLNLSIDFFIDVLLARVDTSDFDSLTI